jgi:hypothetical protein
MSDLIEAMDHLMNQCAAFLEYMGMPSTATLVVVMLLCLFLGLYKGTSPVFPLLRLALLAFVALIVVGGLLM